MFTATPGGLRFTTQPNHEITPNTAVSNVRATEFWHTFKTNLALVVPFSSKNPIPNATVATLLTGTSFCSVDPMVLTV
jgi:hypothetical protein